MKKLNDPDGKRSIINQVEPSITIFVLVSCHDRFLTINIRVLRFSVATIGGVYKISSIIDVREVFCRYSPNEKHNSTKIGEYRCTGTHSTKTCAVGVAEVIGVSNTINYIEMN